MSDNQLGYHKKLGLSTEIGPIFSWADKYDLYIASPNGTKTTHPMVMELTQHPAGNIGMKELKIPRLKQHEVSSLRLTHQAIQLLEHYMGPFKLYPPLLLTKASSPEESQLQSAARRGTAVIHPRRQACRVGGLQCSARPTGGRLCLEGQDTGGVQIDDQLVACHPDTILAMLVYLEWTLNTFGIHYSPLS